MGKIATRLFAEAFETELLETAEQFPDIKAWSVAGRNKRKSNPAGEDLAWWRNHGPGMVQNWLDWRHDSQWQIWTTPDGQPGIELPIEVVVPGAERELWMVIDRVFVTQPSGQLAIVDLKTGSRTPESDLQLAVYRLGIYEKFGIDIRLGAYWMARTGELTDVFGLERLTPELLSLWFGRFEQAVAAGIFLPHQTFRCRACNMRDYCAAYGGSKSEKDPDVQLAGGKGV